MTNRRKVITLWPLNFRWKHPSSGARWLRKGVPEDLRKLVGRREEKRSPQTRDWAAAGLEDAWLSRSHLAFELNRPKVSAHIPRVWINRSVTCDPSLNLFGVSHSIQG